MQWHHTSETPRCQMQINGHYKQVHRGCLPRALALSAGEKMAPTAWVREWWPKEVNVTYESSQSSTCLKHAKKVIGKRVIGWRRRQVYTEWRAESPASLRSSCTLLLVKSAGKRVMIFRSRKKKLPCTWIKLTSWSAMIYLDMFVCSGVARQLLWRLPRAHVA